MSNRLLNQAWALALPSTDKLVLIALADCANAEGETYIAVRSGRGKLDLLRMTGLGERTIQGAIGRLKQAGHITWAPRAGRSTLYTIHPRSTCGVQDMRPAVVAVHPAAVAPAPAAHAGEPLLSITSPPSGSQRLRRSAIPHNWDPPLLHGNAGSVIANWPPERLELEREKFIAHHESEGSIFANWDAAWRKWVLNAAAWDRPTKRSGSNPGWGPVPVGARASA